MMKRKSEKARGLDGKAWSSGELAFITYWRQACPGLPEPEHDVRFHPVRAWRFDFVWRDAGVAVEVEGAVFQRGRHTRGAGFEGDCEKYNAALDLGFRVYRYSTGMLERDPYGVMSQIAGALKQSRKRPQLSRSVAASLEAAE